MLKCKTVTLKKLRLDELDVKHHCFYLWMNCWCVVDSLRLHLTQSGDTAWDELWPFTGDDLEAVRHQDTEAHAGHVQDPLGHHETHREEEVGRRNERQHDQRQSLERDTTQQQTFSPGERTYWTSGSDCFCSHRNKGKLFHHLKLSRF